MNKYNDATVLVVDDEKEIRNMLKEMLITMDCRVLEAANGIEGLEILAKQHDKISLILSDIKMPRMDGIQFLTEVERLYPKTVYMLLSAYGDKENMHKALRMHVYDFIEKPFTLDIFKTRVSNALEFSEHQKLIKTLLKHYLSNTCPAFDIDKFEHMNIEEQNRILQIGVGLVNLQETGRQLKK